MKIKNNIIALSLITASSLVLSSVAMADQEAYRIDNSHSFANWTIRHVASKTSGTFSDVTGKLMLDKANLANSSVEAKISVFSVNTSNAKRDEHIKKR